MRSVTGSSGHGPNSTIQNPGRRDFIGITENTPLKSASSRLALNIDQDRIDETRDIEFFEDGHFLPIRPNYKRQSRNRHMLTGHNAPRKNISDFLTRYSTQNKPLSQQFTQPQNITTHISPNTTLPVVGQTLQRQTSDSGSPSTDLPEQL